MRVLANVLAGVAVLLSAVTFGLTQRFASASDRRARIPVLVFVYDSTGHWLLRNVGNGPALNITLATKARHDDREWQNPTRIPPIAKDAQFKLSWLGDDDYAILTASYEDFLTADNKRRSRAYTVSMAYDLNRIVPIHDLPRWGVDESLASWQREQATGHDESTTHGAVLPAPASRKRWPSRRPRSPSKPSD
jgi:hypothetical protein